MSKGKGNIVAYFASGNRPMDLKSWDIDLLILVDNSFHKSEFGEKIWEIKSDAIEAVDLLASKGIKLDVFISINEGLNEGGGNYPLNGQFFIGYLMRILNPNYIHIYAPNYYSHTSPKYLSHKLPNIPYVINALKQSDFIYDLSLLNNGGGYLPKVFKMKRLDEACVQHPIFKHIKLVRKSIWEDAESLTKLFLPENTMLPYLKLFSTKIIDFIRGDFPFFKLNNVSITKGGTIGLVPWNSKDYKSELLKLNEWSISNDVLVSVYYLDEGDFSKLISD